MIDVQKGALSPLNQNFFPALHHPVGQGHAIAKVRLQNFGRLLELPQSRGEGDCFPPLMPGHRIVRPDTFPNPPRKFGRR